MTMLQPQTKKEEGLINVVHLDLTKTLGHRTEGGREGEGGRGKEGLGGREERKL